jgi:hypothetical protein
MAGSYPNALGIRMAYDVDNSVAQIFYNELGGNTSITRLSSAEKAALNDESSTGVTTASGMYGLVTAPFFSLVFPEPRNISGVYFKATWDVLHYSTDTTNGIDGTWVALAIASSGTEGYRRGSVPAILSGVRGFRLKTSGGMPAPAGFIESFHVYGAYADSNRLAFWDDVDNIELDGFGLDFGNTPQSSTETKAFRLKNVSGLSTANSITISSNGVTTGYAPYPAPAAQYLFSTDGSDFSATVSVPVLYTGKLSNIIYVRRVTPSNAAVGSWAVRILATVGEWR